MRSLKPLTRLNIIWLIRSTVNYGVYTLFIFTMKSKLKINIYESEILKSLHHQSDEETFNFISKILNGSDTPEYTARELIKYLVTYINDYVDCERPFSLQVTSDDDGRLVIKSFSNESAVEAIDSTSKEANFVEV